MEGTIMPAKAERLRVHLVDGSGFVHRAYHAFDKFQRSDGLEVGAIRGFAEMIWRILRVLEASHVAVIMDGGRSFRNDIWPHYKSNRKEVDAELRVQLPLLDQACEAFGLATRRVTDYEADDVIATLAAQVEQRGGIATIHSTDKDFYQLMSANVRIFDPHPKRRRTLEIADCRARFGVEPYQVPCAQGLIGDTSDNIPGVSGIGKVAAGRLLAQYDTLDGIIDAAHAGRLRLNKAQMTSLMEPHADMDGLTGIELAKISRKLATLKLNVPLGFDLGDIERRDPDEGALNSWLKTMEFQGLAAKIEMQAA
jgi:DNA polymerase-1